MKRLVIVVNVDQVPNARYESPEVIAEALLSAYGEYSSPPHTAHWQATGCPGCAPAVVTMDGTEVVAPHLIGCDWWDR